MPPDLHRPWRQFLEELDALLNEPIALHCIGGFALVAAYQLPRSTNDLDYYTLVPCERGNDLEQLAGEGSALAQKYKVHVHKAAVASLPTNYDDRMIEPLPGRFRNIRLFILDPYDLALSKLSRNNGRDRDDVKYIIQRQKLDPLILRQRYADLRVNLIGPLETHDTTLKLWLEAYFQDQ